MPATSLDSDAGRLVAAARGRLAGDVAEAGALARQALESAREASHEIDARLVLAECEENLGRYAESLAQSEAARAAAAAAGDATREAEGHRLAASVHNHLGNLDQAAEHHLACMRLLEATGDGAALARAMAAVGVTASKSKDYARGLDWYRRSLALSRELGDEGGIMRALNNIGIDLKNLGRLEESRQALEELRGLAHERGLGRNEAVALANLGETLEAMGSLDEAESAYRGALGLARAQNLARSVANLEGSLGALLLQRGRVEEGRALLAAGLASAEAAGIRPDVAILLEKSWRLEKAAGDPEAALAAFERYHEVMRGIAQEDSQRRMKALELRMNLERVEREASRQRRRSDELEEAYGRLEAAVAEKNALVTQLERQSREDLVTGLGNRRMLDEELARAFAEARVTGAPLSLAVLEADDFEALADRASHSAIEAALADVARMIRGHIGDRDTAARLGRGQFAILFRDRDAQEAARVCEYIRLAVESQDWARIDPWLRLKLSGGVAQLRGHGSASQLLLDADTRLRVARAGGGNRLEIAGEPGEAGGGPASASVARAAADPRPALILAEQVRAAYLNLPIAFGASLVVATLLCLAVRDLVPVRIWGTWLAALFGLSVVLWNFERSFTRQRPAGEKARRWGHVASAGSLAAGVLWGIGTVLLHTPDSIDYQIMVAATAAIVGSSVAFAAATYLPPFFAFSFPAVLPTALLFIDKGDTARVVIGWLLLFYLALVSRFAFTLNREFVEALRLRFENIALVSELRERQEAAEAANRAKSRFLAAASHDLRQPTHALGLFLQVLRQRPLGARERELVDNIGQSFAAMEALFNALLDISRLDAGVVEPRVSTFPVSRMLERMRAEYEPQAAAKGLRLSVRRCSAYARSDPVLIEEIVGNLLSNAVRHTARGRIVLGCRREAGALRIEVWDTGPGIPLDKQGEVFGEFVQLGNPERDRGKGLGLGLAIVDRLCKLLGHPVELRSWPGMGSLFRIAVPLGRREEADEGSTAPLEGLASLEGRLVAVVDDEATVLAAMGAILGQWGLQVVAAESGALALGKLANASRVPDAILCDYRLRNGESGIEVIREIRDEFNAEIPAALVTGDTDPDRLKEARASGLPLLHKPVTASRLRSLIAQLLRENAEAAT